MNKNNSSRSKGREVIFGCYLLLAVCLPLLLMYKQTIVRPACVGNAFFFSFVARFAPLFVLEACVSVSVRVRVRLPVCIFVSLLISLCLRLLLINTS